MKIKFNLGLAALVLTVVVSVSVYMHYHGRYYRYEMIYIPPEICNSSVYTPQLLAQIMRNQDITASDYLKNGKVERTPTEVAVQYIPTSTNDALVVRATSRNYEDSVRIVDAAINELNKLTTERLATLNNGSYTNNKRCGPVIKGVVFTSTKSAEPIFDIKKLAIASGLGMALIALLFFL